MYNLEEILDSVSNFENTPKAKLKLVLLTNWKGRMDLYSRVLYKDIFHEPANGDIDIIIGRVARFIDSFMFAGISKEQFMHLFNGEVPQLAIFASKDSDFSEKEGAEMTLHGMYTEEFSNGDLDEILISNLDVKFVTVMSNDLSKAVLSYKGVKERYLIKADDWS